MSYQRGEVISMVYHPASTGRRRVTKLRPMVVISSDDYHKERPQDIIVALVTSKVAKYQGVTDYALRDWQAAGLHQPSTVRCTFATIELSQIDGKIGKLTAFDVQRLENVLKNALAL